MADQPQTRSGRCCGDCDFFVRYECDEGIDAEGTCRRHAPQPRVVTENDPPQLATWFPEVEAEHHWCGEFQHRRGE